MAFHTASITIAMTDDEVMGALVAYADKNRGPHSKCENTLEAPYELCFKQCENCPLDKTLWLDCFNKALASKTTVLPSVLKRDYTYRNPVIDLDTVIREAVEAYYETEHYKKHYTAWWDAKKAKDQAEKAEAERIRTDVPAITKMYEALLKEHEALKGTLVNRNRRLEYINGEVKDTKEAWAGNKTKPAVWLVKTIDNINGATDFHTPSTSMYY